LTQSLQEQFSCVQTQQCRILELLAPLHPVLQSVPLHINLARNAILEKIPEGCQCTSGSAPSTQPSCHTLSSQESAEPPMKVRKIMRTNLDRQDCDIHGPPVNCYEGQPIAVEERQILHQPAHKPGEMLTSSRPQRIGTRCSVQPPSGAMNGIGGVIRNHLRNTSPASGNTAFARRLPTIPRGISPRVSSLYHTGIHDYCTSCYAGPCYGSPGEEIHFV